MSGWLLASRINEHEKIVPKKGVVKTGVMPNYKDAFYCLPGYNDLKMQLRNKYKIRLGEIIKMQKIVLPFLEENGIDIREVSGSLRQLTHEFQINRIKEGRPVWFRVKNEKRVLNIGKGHWTGRECYANGNESSIKIIDEIV